MADTGMKILVVDDFATMRRIIRSTLRQGGYKNSDEADDGTTALSKLRTDRFDLVIADWNMPQMTGLDLLKAMRSDKALKHIPFLMVTAEAHKDNIIEAIQSGANNYLVKPFTLETLSEKIDQIFSEQSEV
jgi:two-component system chemotaxis response regulator CheY